MNKKKRKILKKKFYSRSGIAVARDLIGKYLVRKIERNKNDKSKIIALKITETEAYHGHEDMASHAFRGRTPRNLVMFGEAGVWYVYFTYGMHYMLNIVTGKKDHPSAVLIRGTEEVAGPGRLTKFFSIDKKLNGKYSSRGSGLWIEDRGEKVPARKIKRTARIGVDYAGPIWSKKLYRFINKKERN